MKTLALAFLFVAGTSAMMAQETVTLTAQLSAELVLQGEPVDMEFTVDNRSNREFTLPRTFVVEVTPAGGPSRLARWYATPPIDVAWLPLVWKNHTTVPAGQKRTMRWSSWAATNGQGIRPLPIKAPGVYQLRFAFGTGLEALLDHHALFPVESRTLAGLGARTSLLVSKPVRLELETPKGDDAVVWAKILEASHGEPWPGDNLDSLSRDIWENHRSSRYAPFAVIALKHRATADRVRQLRDDLAKVAPRHSYIEWLELVEAKLLAAESGHRVWEGAPLDEARRYEELAEDRYRKTMNSSRHGDIKLEAQAGLDELRDQRETNNDMFESLKDVPRRKQAAVQPLVDCAKVSDKETHVVFAYDNPNRGLVTIRIGPRNLFEPGDMDRGQPTTFGPGRNEKAFRVKVKGGGRLTWTLDGTSVTVDTGKIRRCSDATEP